MMETVNLPANKPSSPTEAPPIKAELARELKLPSAVLGLDVTPDGKTFYAASLDGGVYEVNGESGTTERVGQHGSYASSIHLLPNSSTVVSGGYDGSLQWHDTTTRKTVLKVAAHRFWSWQTAVAPNGQWVASVTGQYLCGGYKYEPLPEQEPSVKIFHGKTGELAHGFSHVPPVQAVAFSPDSQWVAAGNLMGEVRVWALATGQEVARWTTPSFTGWGIIKGHYYTGGIFALAFSPDGQELFTAGMGSTTDPAAGNGRQLWQRFAWRENPVKKVSETREDDSGRGLMETLAFHPAGNHFVMAGRLFNGKWNTAIFEAKAGSLRHSLDAKMRVTRAVFRRDGAQLFLGGATDQGRKKDGKLPESGRIKIFSVSLT